MCKVEHLFTFTVFKQMAIIKLCKSDNRIYVLKTNVCCRRSSVFCAAVSELASRVFSSVASNLLLTDAHLFDSLPWSNVRQSQSLTPV